MTDSGVVDPLRIPPWIREPAERWWRELPPLARVFVGLTLVDILGRSVGLLAPVVDWAYLTPLGFVSTFLPHDLWILLPALLVVRRPDAAVATPWILRGAVIVAVTELATAPLEALLGFGSTSLATLPLLAAVAGSVALLVGWLVLGRGLAALNPGEPTETAAMLANLCGGAVLLSAAIGLASTLVQPALDLGDPGLLQAMTLSSLAASLRLVGWAYLLWVVVRGVGDRRRSPAALTTAASGAILASVLLLAADLASRLLAGLGIDLSSGSGLGQVLMILEWLGYSIGPTLILVAFAIGLAEPPIPYTPPPIVPAAEAEPATAP